MTTNADLKFGKARAKELGIDTHVPYLRHIDENIILAKNGFLVGIIRLTGLPFQTIDQSELNNLMDYRNTVLRNLGGSQFAVYSTIIRRHANVEIEGEFDNPFLAELNARYLDGLEAKNLYVNEAYLTIIRRPMTGKVGMIDKVLSAFSSSGPETENRDEAVQELQSAMDALLQDFSRYGAQKLGVVERRGSQFSEPAEFFAKILAGGDEVEMPLPRMGLDKACGTKQLFFGTNALEIRGATDSKVGAMISIKEYPPYTTPGTLDGLLKLKAEFILTQSFSIEGNFAAREKINTLARQSLGSDQASKSVANSIDDALENLASGDVVFGYHHLAILALGRTAAEMKKAVSDIMAELSSLSVVPVRETLNTEPAFWSLLPGNFKYNARRSLLSSRNFSGLFSGHNFPSGQTKGLHWKLPIALLETTSQTAYNFNFHSGDVGHFTVFGPTGSGKTVVMSFLLAQAMRVRPQPRCIYFDYMRGAEIFVRAMGGRYEVMETKEPTGFAPFQMDDTPDNRAFLVKLLSFILTPDGGSLEHVEQEVVHRAVDGMFTLGKSERTFDKLVQVLRGSLKPGSRIQPWISEKEHGWLFNNPVDLVDFTKPIIGFDMSKILNEPKLRTAALLYIFHRIEEVIDGDPIMIFLDEGWKLLDDEVFSEFIKDKLKTIRRRNGIVGFGTQAAEDVTSSKISTSLIEQTKTNIFFPNAKADRDVYRGRFRLSEKEFAFVQGTAKETRSFLIKHDTDSVIGKLDLSQMPDLVMVLSSNDANVQRCKTLRDQYGDDPIAWLPHFCGWEQESADAA
jgi:type IV secretion system protein VirB4